MMVSTPGPPLSAFTIAVPPVARTPTLALPDAAVPAPLDDATPTAEPDSAWLATTNVSPIPRTESTTVNRYVPGVVKSAAGVTTVICVSLAPASTGTGW